MEIASKKIILGLVLGSIPIIGIVYWLSSPDYYLTMIYYTRRDSKLCKSYAVALANCGNEAIAPTVRVIQEKSPFVRGYGLLPWVLAQLGPPAHNFLIQAIREEKRPDKRSYTIFTIQEAFDDWRYFDLWLLDVEYGRLVQWHIMHMYGLIKRKFNYPNSLFFEPEHFKAPQDLIARLQDEKDPFSTSIRQRLSLNTQKLLAKQDKNFPSKSFLHILASEFNSLIFEKRYLYDEQLLQHLELSHKAKILIDQKSKGYALFYLNRILIEETYSYEIESIQDVVIPPIWDYDTDSFNPLFKEWWLRNKK